MSNKTETKNDAPKAPEPPKILQVTATSRITKLRVGSCAFVDGIFITTDEKKIAELKAALASPNVPNNFKIVESWVAAPVAVAEDAASTEKAPEPTK